MCSRTYKHFLSEKPLISLVIRIWYFQSRVSDTQKARGVKFEICN